MSWAVALAAAGVLFIATLARFRASRSTVEVALVALIPWWIAFNGLMSILLLSLGKWLPGSLNLVVAAGAVLARQPDRTQSQPDSMSGSASIRFLSSNLWVHATDLSALAQEILDADADVILLQELTPSHLETLERLAMFENYRWDLVAAQLDTMGAGLWSRLEIVSSERWHVNGQLQLRCVVLQPCGHFVEVVGVHMPAPDRGHVGLWASSLEQLADRVSDGGTRRAVPLVVAGDFNATEDHRPFRALRQAGLVDAAATRHQGWRMTWPNRTRRWLPRLLRLDHVLVSSDFRVADYRTGRGTPSDHAPITVTLTCCICAERGQPATRPALET